jgi:hypothetical protein
MQLLLLYLPVHTSHPTLPVKCRVTASRLVTAQSVHPSRHILYREPGTAALQLKNRSRPGLPARRITLSVSSRLACHRVPACTGQDTTSPLQYFEYSALPLPIPLSGYLGLCLFASLHLNLFINTPGRLTALASDFASDSRAHLALFRHYSHFHSSSKTCKSTLRPTISTTAIPLHSRRHSHTTHTLNHTHTPNRNPLLSLDILTVLASLTSKILSFPLTLNTRVPICIHTASTLSNNNSSNSSSNNISNISSISNSNTNNSTPSNIHSNMLSSPNISPSNNTTSTPAIPACSPPSLRACHRPVNLACSHHFTPACHLTHYPPCLAPSQCPQ